MISVYICVRVNYYIRLLGHWNANNIRTEIARIMVEELKRVNTDFILRYEKFVSADRHNFEHLM